MKKCVRRGDPQRREHWEAVVRRWREGGQAVRAYCRAEGVRESAFYFWRKKLEGRAGGAAGKSEPAPARPTASGVQPPQATPSHRLSTPSFLPVRLVESHTAGAGSGLEIVLEQGRTVRVSPGFDRQTLADVLAVLEVRPC